jgi:SAM-dependent methyltransferase
VGALVKHPAVSGRWAAGPISWLDVGCGKGIFLKAVRARAPIKHAAGIDIAPQDLPGVEFHQCVADVEATPFSPSTFDVVSCNHVLEHVFHTEFLLREIHRIAKPDGTFVLSVPNQAFWANRLLGLFGWSAPWATEFGTERVTYGVPAFLCRSSIREMKPSGHIRAFTPKALLDLCESCGFHFAGWWRQTDGWFDVAPPRFRGMLAMILRKA